MTGRTYVPQTTCNLSIEQEPASLPIRSHVILNGCDLDLCPVVFVYSRSIFIRGIGDIVYAHENRQPIPAELDLPNDDLFILQHDFQSLVYLYHSE